MCAMPLETREHAQYVGYITGRQTQNGARARLGATFCIIYHLPSTLGICKPPVPIYLE